MSPHSYPHEFKHKRERADLETVRGPSLPPIVECRATVKQQLPSLREALRLPWANDFDSVIKEHHTNFGMAESVFLNYVLFLFRHMLTPDHCR
jgi:hypothetical protein